MPSKSTGRNWLAFVVTTAVFAAVLAVIGRPTNSAPLPEHLRSPTAAMFGGSPSRNLVNLLDRKILTDWCVDEGKEKNVLWSVPLGTKAHGGPIVFGGKIFLGTNNQQPRNPKIVGDKGILMCFEEKIGKFLWQTVHDKLATGRSNDWPEQGIASTPAVEANRAYYVSNRCEVVCVNSANGSVVWKLDMIGKLRVFPHNLANCSPLLMGELLFVVTSNGVDQGHVNVPAPTAPSFLALDKRTGQIVWQDNSPQAPISATVNGRARFTRKRRASGWSFFLVATVCYTPSTRRPESCSGNSTAIRRPPRRIISLPRRLSPTGDCISASAKIPSITRVSAISGASISHVPWKKGGAIRRPTFPPSATISIRKLL